MIQPLRTAHRRIFLGLAAILPAVIVAGLSMRSGRAMKTAAEANTLQNVERSSLSSFVSQKKTFTAKFYSDAGSPSAARFVVQPLRELSDPDLLLYWTEGTEIMSLDMSRAHFLGSFPTAKSFSIPTGQQKGLLILYSPAHRAVVDSAHVEGVP
jgi:hypothetical protein